MEPRTVKESGSVDDSGVYSFNNASSKNSSSTSSFSFSSISMEDSKASSSGCSEERARKKALMKHRVKKCLEELKTLVHTPRAPKKKGDTLKTLQHVVWQMKKYKEEAGGIPSQPIVSVDTELIGVSSEGECVRFPLRQSPSIDTNTWYRIITSDNECTVLDAPSNLLKMLRYPVKYWFGQPLLEYIHKRDVVTVSSHLMSAQNPKDTKEEKDNREETGNNVFFFRIRHYKSIRQGYSLSRAEKYTVFCGRVSRQKLDVKQAVGVNVEGRRTNKEHAILECSPVNTAYAEAYRPPEHNTFFTRHTVHCKYNFVHPSCIPLTGYLPQDLIGASIFDNYHPHDLSILLGCYQQVVAMPGETFRSVPYRLKIKNGQYITVETEWSSFINPWSNKLDFIIGHHNVLEGPQNIDVFNESRRQSVEISPQARSLQKRIRSLLLQAEAGNKETPSEPPGPPSIQEAPQVAVPAAAATSTAPSPLPLPAETNFSAAAEGEETKEQPSTTEEVKNLTGGRDSKVPLLFSEKVNIYEQLNYAHNIRRFLLSCALSQYPAGDSSSSKSTLKDENLELFADKAASNAVNLTLPKPPSFASSTKALVSEREQWEELMPPSPTHEETVEEVPAVSEDTYQHIPLTEEVIELHNKYQLQSYLSKLASEKDILSRQGKLQLHLKRSHSGDASEKNHKISREENFTDATGHRNPPNPSKLIFPHACDEQPSFTNPNLIPISTMHHGPPASHGPPGHHGPTIQHGAALHHGPTTITLPAPHPVRPQSAATGAPPGIEAMRWPCLNLERGFSYMAVPGSYLPPVEAQPVMNICQQNTKTQPDPQPSTSATSNEEGSLKMTNNSKSCEKTSDTSGSLDDYTSSVFYLLDSGSQNNSHSTPSDLEEQNRLSRKNSPWCLDVKWTRDIEMQYTISTSDTNKVLEMDQLHLKKLVQPSVVEEQIQDLLSENTPAETFLMDDDSLIQPGVALPMEEEQVVIHVEIPQDQNKEDKESGDQDGLSEEAKFPSPNMTEEKQKNVSDSDSNDGNTSKSSSDLTPSDQRSHDELPSSGKESDNVSSDNQKRASKREPEPQPLMGSYLMHKLYVPLNVSYQTQQLASPPWLAKAKFSEAVQMQYQAPGGPLEDVLQMDQHQLSHMEQPEAVQEQLDELLADLKQKVSYALTPVTPKEHSPDWGSAGDKSSSNTTSNAGSGSRSQSNSNNSSLASSSNDVTQYKHSPSSSSDEGKEPEQCCQTPTEGSASLVDKHSSHSAITQEVVRMSTGSDMASQPNSESERDSGVKSDCRDMSFSPGMSDCVASGSGSVPPAPTTEECCSMKALFCELGEKSSPEERSTPEESPEEKSPTLGLMMNLFMGCEDMEADCQ